jgi:hypothetical protein
MNIYIIKVTPLVTEELLDYDDRLDLEELTTPFEIEAKSKKEALDVFHECIPIACLEDFEITCTKK